MAKAKSKIVAIAQKVNSLALETGAVFFRIGCTPLAKNGQPCVNPEGEPAFPDVAEIKHCRHTYGQGAAVDKPCYVVSFEDSYEVLVVPSEDVSQVNIMQITEETTPNLPE